MISLQEERERGDNNHRKKLKGMMSLREERESYDELTGRKREKMSLQEENEGMTSLKGQWHELFLLEDCRNFSWIIFLRVLLGPFWFSLKIRKDLRISRCNYIGGKWKKLLNRRFAHVYPKERKGVMSLKKKIEGKMRLKEKRKVEQMHVFVYSIYSLRGGR
jgi:hypothetical protein